jgi:hypothetical protein
MKRSHLALLLVAALSLLVPARTDAALDGAQRSILTRYLSALVAGRYDTAFALLSPKDRQYFRTSANYASVFAADRLKIANFKIVASKSDTLGSVALVVERVAFYDQRRQSPGSATAKVAYGIVRAPNGFAIKDPFHPWRAFTPNGMDGSANGIRVVVRKLSFFTARLEMVVTFANAGNTSVTLLPYGRTVLRDDSGKTYPTIASRLPGLTDKTLYTGLILPPGAQYTGLMTFLTPDRFTPVSLNITFAPALADGGDAPFSIPLRPYTVPS